VLAQEAYGHYYSGDLAEAINVAQRAQDITASTPGVGAVLAAALEARAQAALGSGRSAETRAALARAETILGQLDRASAVASAFGYNEAQLRFHEGSAYTHLHDTDAAWSAQQRALQLCPADDYMDRTLTRLDRATCLVHDRDISSALPYAIEALTPLSAEQRQGIITLRGHGILRSLTEPQQGVPSARDLRELLMSTPEQKEVNHPQ
jgi:hypothetical protein